MDKLTASWLRNLNKVDQLAAENEVLRKENKKLRELWAAVQKHKMAKKEDLNVATTWAELMKIYDDLNQGNF